MQIIRCILRPEKYIFLRRSLAHISFMYIFYYVGTFRGPPPPPPNIKKELATLLLSSGMVKIMILSITLTVGVSFEFSGPLALLESIVLEFLAGEVQHHPSPLGPTTSVEVHQLILRHFDVDVTIIKELFAIIIWSFLKEVKSWTRTWSTEIQRPEPQRGVFLNQSVVWNSSEP